MKLWQLKSLSSGAALNEPQPLPDNWGPIFGLSGFEDKLSDLSWLGPEYEDMGWFPAGEQVPVPVSTPEELAWEKAKRQLRDSDWSMLPDVPMTSGEKTAWIEYRRQLREIRLHPDFPNMVWPSSPE